MARKKSKVKDKDNGMKKGTENGAAENEEERGELSIETEDLFPIIKKWLYSEKDIFLREIVANAQDAIKKLEKIISFGDYSGTVEPLISISTDREKGTLTVSDNGLGMTAEEIKRYINQIAFSGIRDFVDRYREKDEKDQIIGFFGVGFYSAFMVSEKVEIITRSYREGATAVKWSCSGTPEYTLADTERAEVGTDVVLYIDGDNRDFLKERELKKILHKHCQFLPVPITLNDEQVNDPEPIWKRSPSSVSDEEYREFYGKLFSTMETPLFWIHLNVDYPFDLRAVLYFPRLKREMESPQQQISIFCNQMFVTDHSKELVPEFLTLLQGAVDSPDIPLNISRSMLQRDPTVVKIGKLITKEVAGRINSMYEKERERYEEIWEEISPIIKYGSMQDEGFSEKISGSVIFETTRGGHTTVQEYVERNGENTDNTIFYAADKVDQAAYLELILENDLEALIMGSMLDAHYIQFLESKDPELHFMRVDSDISRFLQEDEGGGDKGDEDEEDGEGTKKGREGRGDADSAEDDRIEELFKKYLEKENLLVQVEALKTEKIAGMLVIEEHMRRFEDMSKLFKTQNIPIHVGHALVVNKNSPIIANLLKLYRGRKKAREEKMRMLCRHVYDLALLAQGKLKGDELMAFVKRSGEVLRDYSS